MNPRLREQLNDGVGKGLSFFSGSGKERRVDLRRVGGCGTLGSSLSCISLLTLHAAKYEFAHEIVKVLQLGTGRLEVITVTDDLPCGVNDSDVPCVGMVGVPVTPTVYTLPPLRSSPLCVSGIHLTVR